MCVCVYPFLKTDILPEYITPKLKNYFVFLLTVSYFQTSICTLPSECIAVVDWQMDHPNTLWHWSQQGWTPLGMEICTTCCIKNNMSYFTMVLQINVCVNDSVHFLSGRDPFVPTCLNSNGWTPFHQCSGKMCKNTPSEVEIYHTWLSVCYINDTHYLC